MSYANPVISGFYPDPSVCRVGEDYYLVCSTFEYFPGVPIFHSRDMINWQQIGHCLTRPSQLNLAQAGCSNGIMAATIRYHAGIFYMTTTNVSDRGNFYVWTHDPTREWSDPIWIEQGGYDASLYFENNKVYFTSAGDLGQGLGIYQSEIRLETGQSLSAVRLIWQGTGGAFPEAPHLYNVDGTYYLLIAEGGTQFGHMTTIARSSSPWGPFETCPTNPILSHRQLIGRPIQGTGHADLVQASDQSWWLVCLAFRPVDLFYHHLGREVFLAPVSWNVAGWPVVYKEGVLELEMEASTLPLQPWPLPATYTDFDELKLAPYWNFLRNPYPQIWSLEARPGYLRLYGLALTLNEVDSPAFIGRRQQHFDCRVSALLDFSPQNENEEAGLTVLANNTHHYEIAVTKLEGEKCIIVRRRIGDLAAIVARQTLKEGPLKLAIHAEALNYKFLFSYEQESLQLLATGATRYLATEVVDGFTGVYFGMYATGNGRASSSPADFDWFDYQFI